MTGYGLGTSGNFKVEIRSSNHKNLDIQVNIPYYLFSYEADIKKIVKQRFSRGRIEILVPRQALDNIKMKVNMPLAREYFRALTTLKDELSISDTIGINLLAAQRDVFMVDEPEIDISGFNEALEKAVDDLDRTRKEEGRNLVADMTERLLLVETYTEKIEQIRADFTATAVDRLRERLSEFLGDMQIEESRIIQEAAILVEKADITEEIVRIKSHLNLFRETLSAGGTIGKKLDFIIQELRRETNTIGSKAQTFEIANNVVEIKHELEKIREQVQNVQ